MKVNLDHCSSIVSAEVIKLLGGDPTELHTQKSLTDNGNTWKIQSWGRSPNYVIGQRIDEEKAFTDSNLRYLVQINEEGIDAFKYDGGENPVLLDIRLIWRYLWLCKVIEDAPPRLFKAYGELCFEDQDGNQLFANVAIEEATFDPATNEFTVVVGRFDAHPLLVPDAWRANPA